MITSTIKKILLGLLWAYQHTLSPDHGLLQGRFPYGACRYYPSCSEYARQAIIIHSLARSFKLIISRLLRCHPFALGGEDFVPSGLPNSANFVVPASGTRLRTFKYGLLRSSAAPRTWLKFEKS